MKEPRVTISPKDVYLLKVSEHDLQLDPNPYDFENDLNSYTHIAAVDFKGQTIPLDENHFILDTSKVNYAKEGAYFVTVSVLDDYGNMKLDYLTIHVLSDEEASQLDDADESDDQNDEYEDDVRSNKKKKQRKRKNKGHKSSANHLGGIIPKDPEKLLRLKDNTFLSKSATYEDDEDYEKKHVFDKNSNRLIWGGIGIVILFIIIFFWKLFF